MVRQHSVHGQLPKGIRSGIGVDEKHTCELAIDNGVFLGNRIIGVFKPDCLRVTYGGREDRQRPRK